MVLARKKWSIYEVVILLNGYLEAQKREQPMAHIAGRVSDELHRMAQNTGADVDKISKNTNGVIYQMQRMQCAFKGIKIYGENSSLFAETVTMYRENRCEYDRILKEAMAMIGVEYEEPIVDDTNNPPISPEEPDTNDGEEIFINNTDETDSAPADDNETDAEVPDDALSAASFTEEAAIEDSDEPIPADDGQVNDEKVTDETAISSLSICEPIADERASDEPDTCEPPAGETTSAEVTAVIPYEPQVEPSNAYRNARGAAGKVGSAQPKWNIHEAVILLDGYLEIHEKRQFKECVKVCFIKRISDDLRRMAVNNGIDIDDIYRNENDVICQIQSMDSAYKGLTVKFPATKLFTQTVAMYRGNRSEYDKLLEEARIMIYGKKKTDEPIRDSTADGDSSSVSTTISERRTKTEQEFFEWLSEKANPEQCSDFYLIYKEIEQYCVDCYILKSSLFAEITRSEAASRLVAKLKGDRRFMRMFAKYGRRLHVALTMFELFCKEKMPQGADNDASKIQQSEDVRDSSSTLKTAQAVPIIEETESATVDFNNLQPMTFTKPISFTYFGDKHSDLVSWKQLYIGILYCLSEDYPDEFLNKMNPSTSTTRHALIGKLPNSRYMTSPKKVRDGIYAETNLSATDIIHRTKEMLDICRVDYENVVITYSRRVTKEEKVPDAHEHRAAPKAVPTAPLPPQAKEYAEVLEKYFGDNGYQPERAISRGRFKRNYAEMFGHEITEDDDVWENILRRVGDERDGRIFPAQNGAQENMLQKIIEDIETTLRSGASGIFSEALFDKYRTQLSDSMRIYNQDAMTDLLLDNSEGRFAYKSGCFVIGRNRPDSYTDIMRTIKEQQEPINSEQLSEKLWYIPTDRIKAFISKEPRIVRAEQNSYYYAPNLPISTDEMKQVIRAIQNEISSCGYIVGDKLVDVIYKHCPNVETNTSLLPQACVRNSLAYLLGNRFSFKNGVVTLSGDDTVGIAGLCRRFVREHERFTFDELKEFSNALGVGIYWDTVLRDAVRISYKEFIRRDLITFDTKAIDDFLEEQCPGDYIPLKDVSLYLSFPAVGYPWNIFLLESYLYNTSKKFCLIHVSFSQRDVYGAMVRVNSDITDYHALSVDVLSAPNAPTTNYEAISYLVKRGLQQRAVYNGISDVVREAAHLREKRAAERK